MQVDLILRKILSSLFLLKDESILKVSFALKYLRECMVFVFSLKELESLAATGVLLGQVQTLMMLVGILSYSRLGLSAWLCWRWILSRGILIIISNLLHGALISS